MSRTWPTGSANDRLIRGSFPVNAAPLTLACWGKCTSLSSGWTGSLISICSSTLTTDNWFVLGCAGSDVGNGILAGTMALNGGNTAYSTAAVPVGSWFHAAAVFASSTSRIAYLNGGNAGSKTTSKTPSTIDRLVLGAAYGDAGNSYGYPHYGYAAEAAVWSAALTAAQVASLAAGWSPTLIRPDALVAYYPLGGLCGQDDNDHWKNGYHLTAAGSVGWANHPQAKFIYPRRRAA